LAEQLDRLPNPISVPIIVIFSSPLFISRGVCPLLLLLLQSSAHFCWDVEHPVGGWAALENLNKKKSFYEE
jgi:hypothetical protein